MSTTNNVISLEHSVALHVENAIVDVLSNRGGKWVGEFVLVNAAERVAIPNLNVIDVIHQMVEDETLEKSFQSLPTKFGGTIQAPLYRLAPSYS